MEASSAEHVLNGHAETRPNLELILLDLNQLPHVWDQVLPLLQRACDYSAGEFTPETVVMGMGPEGSLRMLALVTDEGVHSIMIVTISIHPNGRKLDCLLTSGEDVDEWMPFEPRMDEWARSLGCIAVRIPRARKGWTRVLSHWAKLSGACYVLEREI